MYVPTVPFNMGVAMAVAMNSFCGDTTTLDGSLKPLPEQFDLMAGDKVVSVSTNAEVDDLLTIMELVDPEDYKDRYPNWETRYYKNHHVLARWLSHHHKEPNLGWFPRIKLIKLDDDQYAELKGYIENKLPESAPQWLDDCFIKFSNEMSEYSPSQVPRAAICGKCGGHNVEIHVMTIARYANRAGMINIDPAENDGKTTRYVFMSDGEFSNNKDGHLHCEDCGARRDLDEATLDMLLHVHQR